MAKRKKVKKKVSSRSPRMPKLFSVPEVAAMKKVTRTAVLLACKGGRIPDVQLVGRTWIIPEYAIDSYTPRPYGVG